MAKVLVVGLNPAWQKVLKFTDLKIDDVNRAESMFAFASGKGINVAKVLTRLGHQVWLLQILGGTIGHRINLECEALGIHCINIWTANETRVCTTLLNQKNGEVTELIEPFTFATQPDDKTNFTNDLILSTLRIFLPSNFVQGAVGSVLSGTLSAVGFDGVVISGSVPKNVDAHVTQEILKWTNAKISVIDTWQGFNLTELCEASCVKINAQEFKNLQNIFGSESVESSKVSFAITNGASPAIMNQPGSNQTKITLPKWGKIINPIGAGDTVTAGLLHFLMNGSELAVAFSRALSMGSASCLTPIPGDYLEADSQQILSQMVIENV